MQFGLACMRKLGVVAASCVAGLACLPFALLSYDPYFVDRLRPYFPVFVINLRLRLEAGDPTVPKARSMLWAKERRACAAALLSRARQNCGGERCGVVFVGDSILDGLTGLNCYDPSARLPLLKSAFDAALPRHWRPLVIAGSGDQTQHVLWHLERCLPELRSPRAFFILLGSNNLALMGSMTPEETLRGLRAVVQALRLAHPNSVVLLHSILPRFNDQALFQKDPSRTFQAKIDKANRLIAEWARPSGVFHVDCNAIFPRGTGQDARALMPDLIHPNAEGYRRWFRCLVPIFRRALNETSSSQQE